MKNAVLSFIFVYALVLVINDGFMASDEYWTAMTRYLPAQSAQLKTLVSSDDVKSPLQILPMHLAAQTAYQLGLTSSYAQYRFVILTIALINIFLIVYSIHLLSQIFPIDKKYYWILFTFYFAAPFALTRPMFESLAAPWLFLSVAFGTRYDQSERKLDLMLATLAVSFAFILRQQVGFCALGLVALTVYKKRYHDLLLCCLLGLTMIALSGIPDYFIRGQFHYSLLAVTTYNFQHGHEYGNEPWTYYPLMIFALSLTPFFIFKYPKNFWSTHLKNQRLNLVFIVLFVFLHSLFPQKFERFLISILPLMIFFMTAIYRQLYTEKHHRKARWYCLLFINFFLFLPASFSPAQKNIIDLARYLNTHPSLTKVYSVNDSLSWIPDIFIENSHPGIVQIKAEDIENLDINDCTSLIVVNSHFEANNLNSLSKFNKAKNFSVNYIEKIAYTLNQKNNIRRTDLIAYTCRSLQQ